MMMASGILKTAASIRSECFNAQRTSPKTLNAMAPISLRSRRDGYSTYYTYFNFINWCSLLRSLPRKDVLSLTIRRPNAFACLFTQASSQRHLDNFSCKATSFHGSCFDVA